MIPILISAIPSAIVAAERIFGKKEGEQSRGAEKKSYVMMQLELHYDFLKSQGMIPAEFLDKSKVLEACDSLVEQAVAKMKALFS